jgi:hypothetical protein
MSTRKPPVKVDWPALKMLYATGMSHADIHEQTKIPMGTIAYRSAADGWAEARAQVQEVSNRSLATAQAGIVSKQKRAENWETRVATQADKSLSVLEKENPTDIKSADKFVNVLEKTDKIGRRSLGLESEDSGNKTVVNLGILQDHRAEPIRAEIIDIPVSIPLSEN